MSQLSVIKPNNLTFHSKWFSHLSLQSGTSQTWWRPRQPQWPVWRPGMPAADGAGCCYLCLLLPAEGERQRDMRSTTWESCLYLYSSTCVSSSNTKLFTPSSQRSLCYDLNVFFAHLRGSHQLRCAGSDFMWTHHQLLKLPFALHHHISSISGMTTQCEINPRDSLNQCLLFLQHSEKHLDLLFCLSFISL